MNELPDGKKRLDVDFMRVREQLAPARKLYRMSGVLCLVIGVIAVVAGEQPTDRATGLTWLLLAAGHILVLRGINRSPVLWTRLGARMMTAAFCLDTAVTLWGRELSQLSPTEITQAVVLLGASLILRDAVPGPEARRLLEEHQEEWRDYMATR